MENQLTILPEAVQIALETLTENLQSAEPFVLYERAQARMNADQTARSLLEKLSTAQAALRSKQASGGIGQEDIEQLRSLQQTVQQNPAIMDFAKTQQAAVAYLREVNQEISQLIGLDFASLARKSCC